MLWGEAWVHGNTLRIGNEVSNVDKYIHFQNDTDADHVLPGFKWDYTTTKIQWSNDGSTWNDFSSGGGITTYADVATAKTASGTVNDLVYVVSTDTFYRYINSAYSSNDINVLTTNDGGSTRWVAVAGRYAHTVDTTYVNTGLSYTQNVVLGMGAHADNAISSSGKNVAIGYNTGANITQVHYNTLVGAHAGEFLASLTGYMNTAIGVEALRYADSYSNVAVGMYAASGSSGTHYAGNNNVAIGREAHRYSTGSGCTFVGYQAGYTTNTGNYNTGIGYQAMNTGVTGTYNIALGVSSGSNITSGEHNIAIGYLSLDSLTTGSDNIGIGQRACQGITRVGAIGIGSYAAARSYGDYSVHIGYYSGQYAGGTSNVAVGAYSMQGTANNLGIRNVAIGYESLKGIGTSASSSNVAIGYQAMDAVAGGSDNVAVGPGTLGALTTAQEVVAIGNSAGGTETTGIGSISVGARSDGYGTKTISIGYESKAYGTTSIAIGENAISVQQDAIQLGTGTNNITPSTTDAVLQVGYGYSEGIPDGPTYECIAVSWNSTSDIRMKENVVSLNGEDSLAFLDKLNPVSYNLKNDKKIPAYGLIAQEVKEAFDNQKHTAYADYEEVYWTVNYNQFVAPLISAVQELSSKVKELEQQIETLKMENK